MYSNESHESLGFEIVNSGFGSRHQDDVVHSVIHPTANEHHWKRQRLDPKMGHKKGPWMTKRRVSESSTSSVEDEPSKSSIEQVVRGSDIGDVPTEYTVQGLHQGEQPAIGTYIDKRVIPGFKYTVRILDTKRHLFKGKPLTLQNIGMGYGKRITMEGDTLNFNTNYFYSDTYPNGYGFNLSAVEAGDKFILRDQDYLVMGKLTVDYVVSQKELDSEIHEDGAIEKTATVTFGCTIQYGNGPHGLRPLMSSQSTELSGLASVLKTKGSRRAITKCIEQVELPHTGSVVLEYTPY